LHPKKAGGRVLGVNRKLQVPRGWYSQLSPSLITSPVRFPIIFTLFNFFSTQPGGFVHGSNSNPGLSLTELGQMIVARKELDVRFAINMDGGGSTTFVQNHTVQNHPHCLDVGFIPCERRVASVVCLVEPTNPKRETEERLHVTNQESDDPRIA